MGAGTVFILLIILGVIAVAVFGLGEVLAFVNNTTNGIFDSVRNGESSIPIPPKGSTILDLTITVKPKIKASNSGAGCPVLCTSVDYLIFLNSDGGTVSKVWTNDRIQKLSLVEMNTLSDYLSAGSTLGQITDLQTGEIVLSTSNSLSSEFQLSYILVDPETGLKKELPHYQNVKYKFPALTKEYSVTEKLVFRGIEKKNYELWITPDKLGFFDTRFADKALGEPYIQKIAGK